MVLLFVVVGGVLDITSWLRDVGGQGGSAVRSREEARVAAVRGPGCVAKAAPAGSRIALLSLSTNAVVRLLGTGSRVAVTDDGFDDVTGFLHVRDLLGVDADDPRHVRDVQREILTLPSTNKVLPTVSLMRKRGVHLALVVDEYGGTDGIVTLEDLVEEIVGEIRDEYDEPDAGRDEPGVVHGAMSLEDCNDHTGLELPDGDYDTVAGYLVARVGRIPAVGDSVAGRHLARGRGHDRNAGDRHPGGNGPGEGHGRRGGPREGRTVGRRSPSGSLSERSP